MSNEIREKSSQRLDSLQPLRDEENRTVVLISRRRIYG